MRQGRCTRIVHLAALSSLALLSLGFPVSRSQAAETEAVTFLRCGRLLDPATGKIAERALVMVRGERVAQVGTDLPAPPAGAKVIDLSRYTASPSS